MFIQRINTTRLGMKRVSWSVDIFPVLDKSFTYSPYCLLYISKGTDINDDHFPYSSDLSP